MVNLFLGIQFKKKQRNFLFPELLFNFLLFFFRFLLYSFLTLLFTRHQSPFQLIFKRRKEGKKENVKRGNFCTEAKMEDYRMKKKEEFKFHKKNNHTQLREKENTIDYV